MKWREIIKKEFDYVEYFKKEKQEELFNDTEVSDDPILKMELIMTRSKEIDEMNLFKIIQNKLREVEKNYLKARIHMEMFINRHPNKLDMWQHEVDRFAKQHMQNEEENDNSLRPLTKKDAMKKNEIMLNYQYQVLDNVIV